MTKDIVIIGGGPSGLTSAIYALRAGKSVLLIEKEAIGGQIATSPRVENYPSIKEISGIELSNNMFEQALSLGMEFELDEISSISQIEGSNFQIQGKYACYEGKSIIIATGVKHRHINVPGEDELLGKGLSYCATCDGPFFKGEDVSVIGDANTALQYTLLLSQYCNKVYLNTLFDKFFGDKILVDQIKKRDNIIIRHNLSLKEFIYDDTLKGLKFEDTKTDEVVEFQVKGCFIAIGQVANNDIFKDLVELSPDGFIVVNEKMETKTKGIYAAGDCTKKQIKQLATAINDGAISAINACNYIDSLI